MNRPHLSSLSGTRRRPAARLSYQSRSTWVIRDGPEEMEPEGLAGAGQRARQRDPTHGTPYNNPFGGPEEAHVIRTS
jgi:hypothetical protein